MSNHLTSLAYKLDVGSLLRKSVLVMLADKASDDGSGIWASKQTMADELCCTKQAIIKTVQAFIAEGILKETGHRHHANGHTVTYALDEAALNKLPRVKRWAVDRSTTDTGQPDLPVNDDDATGKPGLPKPPSTPRRPKKATPPLVARELPDDWHPSEFGKDTESRKVVDSWPPGVLASQLEHFRAHHRMKGSKWKDWQSAWSSWVLNSKTFGARNVHQPANDGPQSPMARALIANERGRAGQPF